MNIEGKWGEGGRRGEERLSVTVWIASKWCQKSVGKAWLHEWNRSGTSTNSLTNPSNTEFSYISPIPETHNSPPPLGPSLSLLPQKSTAYRAIRWGAKSQNLAKWIIDYPELTSWSDSIGYWSKNEDSDESCHDADFVADTIRTSRADNFFCGISEVSRADSERTSRAGDYGWCFCHVSFPSVLSRSDGLLF